MGVLLDTVKNSLKQVGNLALLMGLLFFIYAALGAELFGCMDCTEGNPCDGLSPDFANFKSFGMAMLILFRLTTGDNWNGIMKDGLRSGPQSMGINGTCSFAVNCVTNCCEGCDADPNCKENCCASHFMSSIY